MPLLASIAAAVIPILVYLFIIWRMDKYDSEPLLFVLLHFLWGAFGAIAFGIIGSLLLVSFTGITDDSINSNSLIQTIIFAPISEEIAKGLFLILSVNSRKFDNITDGLVYGGAIGLGFGMTENFTYFISYGDTLTAWIYLVIIRSGFSAVMHCISTGTFGAFLGFAKFNLKSSKVFLPIIGMFLAILIHFFWNLTVSFNETYLYGFLFMFIVIIFYVTIFKYSIKKERQFIIDELTEESNNNLIPRDHIEIIASKLRFNKGWIDETIRKDYFRSAIKLAFQKRQYSSISGYKKLIYEYEIEQLRNKIKKHLLQIEST